MKRLSLIECKKVRLVLDGKELLKNVSFTLHEGEDFVVFGPNGAGKTLLLQVLSGNLQPTSGEVFIFGKPLYAKDAYQIKKQIGFVSPKLFDDYDFRSNVTDIVMSGMFGSIGVANDPTKHNNKVVREYITRVLKEKYQDSKALELLEELQIGYLKDQVFGHLSYGEKVRVLIARALINNPPLFILDEPTTGLDLKMRAEFYRVVEHLAKRAEIVYVTHHLEEILPSFKKVLLLKKGEIFAVGEKETLLTSEHLSQLLNTPVTVHEKDKKYFALF